MGPAPVVRALLTFGGRVAARSLSLYTQATFDCRPGLFTMDSAKKRAPTTRKFKRREQQRAIETRLMILDAALTEFAQRGFEAASIRRIAERTRLQHPLVTYHFKSKLILWRAVAEHAFAEIKTAWDRQAPPDLGSHIPTPAQVRSISPSGARTTMTVVESTVLARTWPRRGFIGMPSDLSLNVLIVSSIC